MNIRPMVPMLCLLALVPLPGDTSPRAREATARGEIVPLGPVLEWLERYYHGQTLDVELAGEGKRLRYRVAWLTPTGEVLEFAFDAASGEFLAVEGTQAGAVRRESGEIRP